MLFLAHTNEGSQRRAPNFSRDRLTKLGHKKSGRKGWDWETLDPQLIELRDKGLSYEGISLRLNVPPETLRYRIYTLNVHLNHSKERLRIAKMKIQPKDTRSITGKFCGDPLPGRSALDKLNEI